MRSFIQKIPTLRNLFYPKPDIKALGRWSFLDDAKLYRRADLSNEDHCGPCGTYIMEKQTERHNVRTRMEVPSIPKKITREDRVNVRTQFK